MPHSALSPAAAEALGEPARSFIAERVFISEATGRIVDRAVARMRQAHS